MIEFGNIKVLDNHVKKLQKILKKDVFLVGGPVRDVLMGVTTNPIDVDVTCAVHPDEVFAALQDYKNHTIESVQGLFRTEKFGTATIIVPENIGVVVNDDAQNNTQDNLDEDRDSENLHREEIAQYTYEITPFREEGGYTDRRHPTEVSWSTSLVVDAGRRDFTINAMYYTSIGHKDEEIAPSGAALLVDTDQLLVQLTRQGWSYIPGSSLLIVQSHELIELLFPVGEFSADNYQQWANTMQAPYLATTQPVRFLLDPMCGMQDFVAQKLRTVGEADKRFQEDALRIMRALRFVNVWNQQIPKAKFDFHKDTWNSMKKNYYLIQYLAKERIHAELVKVFSANNPFGYVALLDELNLLQYIFPSLARCKHNDQPVRYHPFDTYAHTMLTLWHLQQMNSNYLVKLGMLYHDVGKPDQYYYYAQCKTKEEIEALHGSWANHTVCGPEFAEKDFEALSFSRKEIEEIAWYVAQHMRPGQILEAREDNQRKKMRLLYSEFGFDRVKNLLDICKSDRLGQYNPLQSAEIDSVDSLYAMLEELRDTEGQFTKKDIIVSGTDIMSEFGLEPGPQIGEILEKVFQRVIHDADSRNKKSAILSYIKGLVK